MDDEYHHMDHIIPGLWIGDLHSATDGKTLTANNIRSILTVMRGRLSIPEVAPMLRITLTYTQLIVLHRL
jgi:dual specificity phosphatase 12